MGNCGACLLRFLYLYKSHFCLHNHTSIYYQQSCKIAHRCIQVQLVPRLAFKATQLGTLGCMRFELPIRHEKSYYSTSFHPLCISDQSQLQYKLSSFRFIRNENIKFSVSVSLSLSPLCLMLIYNAVMDSVIYELLERAKVFKL